MAAPGYRDRGRGELALVGAVDAGHAAFWTWAASTDEARTVRRTASSDRLAA